MKKYIKPYMEIEEFETEDIITTSNPESTVNDEIISKKPETNLDEAVAPGRNNADNDVESHEEIDRRIPQEDVVSIGDVDYFFSPD